MKMLKRSIYTLMPSLAFLTFKSKGGGGGSTTTIDPEVRDRIMMPAYQAAERAAGATPSFDAKGNFESYAFDPYEGYDGQRLTEPNAFYDYLTDPTKLDNTLTWGHDRFGTAMNNAESSAGYGGPPQVKWKTINPTADVRYNDAGASVMSAPRDAAASQIMNQNISAASLGRDSIRDVNNAGVTGAAVAADAFGSLAPQARASIRDVAGQGFMGGGLGQYMNPYRSQVIDTTMEALDRQRQIQQQQNAASAVNAGAFGGSRQGVVEAETNRAFADQAAQTMAALNAQGFDTAASLQQADADRALQAQLANQGVDQSTTQQALNLSGQFGLANQEAALNAALANQGVDLNVGQLNTQNAQQAAVQNAANNLAAQQSNQQSALQASLANQQADLSRYGQDAQLAQQAALQNAAMGLTASTTNQATEMDRLLANQDAFGQWSRANSQFGLDGQQLAMAGNQQLAELLGQGRDAVFQNLDTRLGAGDMLDARSQDQLDLAYQNWMDEQNHELNQANILQGAASGYPTGSTTTGGGKIICTMMNESYGFGHFRNQIWLEQSANLDPAIERGYHKIFLPVIAFAKGDGWMSRVARKIMEHGARHRTADIWKQKRGKRDRIGQAYRLVFEPICYVVGKVVK